MGGDSLNETRPGCYWSESEVKHHINYFELLTKYNALTILFKDATFKHIRVYSSNTKGTSHSSTCNSLLRQAWLWAIEKDIWISIDHIPGILNVEADQKSRETPRDSESKVFSYNSLIFFQP